MGTTTSSHRRRRKHSHSNSHSNHQVPKGCLAVRVGEPGGEQNRFVVPVMWFNHPLFVQLLQKAEEEYGFEQMGTIAIPCNVHHFRAVVSRIIHHNHHHGRRENVGCFRVWGG
ncbi:hypothetical protein SSX86_006900 [Deinandra increscens subsp. villosa]|uniref:Small auxin up regulated protein n=1 Tax=Deinandra increscens subsp. villosa TaxID=3103831 RepID=A0AAP0DNP7_9ASTR